MGMRRLGKRAMLCLREPSLGPVFGVKGGGTGRRARDARPRGRHQPALHGGHPRDHDGHNLLSAMIDNACHFGTASGKRGRLDARAITWGRALDMNDRALRNVVVGLGQSDRRRAPAGALRHHRGERGDGHPRAREGQEPISRRASGASSWARDRRAAARHRRGSGRGHGDGGAAARRAEAEPGADAEGGPALVHAGPFANIAHGCSSCSRRASPALSDYVITEAGFGFDLGGEKFLDIKCRTSALAAHAVVLVATLRALKMHGGVPGASSARCDRSGVRAVACDAFARGGEGALDLARAVAEEVERTDASPPAPRFTYELDDPLPTKIEKVAKAFYGADGVVLTNKAQKDIERIGARGASLPVCMAKTQLSLTDDPERQGRPKGFTVTVREARLAAGAGFVVALTGDLMTMPGLPKEPAAKNVRVDAGGRIRGLMQGD
jgi:formate--tetrahydrofolate ligase